MPSSTLGPSGPSALPVPSVTAAAAPRAVDATGRKGVDFSISATCSASPGPSFWLGTARRRAVTPSPPRAGTNIEAPANWRSFQGMTTSSPVYAPEAMAAIDIYEQHTQLSEVSVSLGAMACLLGRGSPGLVHTLKPATAAPVHKPISSAAPSTCGSLGPIGSCPGGPAVRASCMACTEFGGVRWTRGGETHTGCDSTVAMRGYAADRALLRPTSVNHIAARKCREPCIASRFFGFSHPSPF
jgi:hypothetical protein